MDRFRVHAVVDDAMEPMLRGSRDYVLGAPVTSYVGEGIYLVDGGHGIDLFRARQHSMEKAASACCAKPALPIA